MVKKENVSPPAPEWYLQLEKDYLEALMRKQEAEEKLDKLKAAMLCLMEQNSLKHVETVCTITTYTATSTGRKFNSTNFKKDYPELYDKYATSFLRSAYVTIKLN